MISFIRGIIFEHRDGAIVVDVNGVGYELIIHQRALSGLPPRGSELFIHTYLQVLENEFKLYGFLEREELHLFQRLLGVSGMGAKGALNILAAMSPAEFFQAVASQDEKTLTRIPGIGKKSAQRLIFELKDKIADFAVSSTGDKKGELLNELMEALEVLGYNRSEVFPLLVNLEKEGDLSSNIEENIKKVLQIKAMQMKR